MITRFAPSPTGPLHIGHAYSAILAHDLARRSGGEFHLRIEDIDVTRSRVEWEDLIYEDLSWLGLAWDGPVIRQSGRGEFYRAALARLYDAGLLYRCTCTRRDITEALSAPQEEYQIGFDGLVYPGTCREACINDAGDFALRVDMRKAVKDIESVKYFENLSNDPGSKIITSHGLAETTGDVVIARKDIGTSYHLAVVVDDASQGITDVVRGEDLETATPIHVLLQRLLGCPTPAYHHHHLIRDDAGKRLAKRDNARAVRKYRDDGATPDDIRELVGLPRR